MGSFIERTAALGFHGHVLTQIWEYTSLNPLPTVSRSGTESIYTPLSELSALASKAKSLKLGLKLYPQMVGAESLLSNLVTFSDSWCDSWLTQMGNYNIYRNDRLSGVLESVLAQPVTRQGLAISRYVSTFGGMSVAILALVAVLDLVAQYFTKSFLSPTIMLSSTGALLVELAAFIGIMMLLSHLVRSSGALLGIGVGLFLVIDFFSGLIVTLLSSLFGIESGSVAFYNLSVGLEFANPAQFMSLVGNYLANVATFVGLGGTSFPITPESYGITVPTIVIPGILWISVPLTIFLYLAMKQD